MFVNKSVVTSMNKTMKRVVIFTTFPIALLICLTGCMPQSSNSNLSSSSKSNAEDSSNITATSAVMSSSSMRSNSSVQSSQSSSGTSPVQDTAKLKQATDAYQEATGDKNGIASIIVAEDVDWLLVGVTSIDSTLPSQGASCIMHIINGKMTLVLGPNSEFSVADMTKASVPLAIQAVATGKTVDQIKQSNEYKYPIISNLPYSCSETYDNYNYTHDFVISYGPSPDKANSIAILITDKSITPNPPDDAKQFAISFTKNWIKEQGFNPDDYEIIYSYELINNN